jgi:hypothetical protein
MRLLSYDPCPQCGRVVTHATTAQGEPVVLDPALTQPVYAIVWRPTTPPTPEALRVIAQPLHVCEGQGAP